MRVVSLSPRLNFIGFRLCWQRRLCKNSGFEPFPVTHYLLLVTTIFMLWKLTCSPNVNSLARFAKKVFRLLRGEQKYVHSIYLFLTQPT